jgi:hypothetical protein
MKLWTKILIVIIFLGTASCVVGTYPDDDGYRYSPYYQEYRGYPEDYFNNRPDYGYHRDRDRHEREEHEQH